MSFSRNIRHGAAPLDAAFVRPKISNGVLGVLLLLLFCAAQILWTLPGTSDAASIMATAEGVYLSDSPNN
jgi:hypothetical protein